jgi:hypothetical protein
LDRERRVGQKENEKRDEQNAATDQFDLPRHFRFGLGALRFTAERLAFDALENRGNSCVDGAIRVARAEARRHHVVDDARRDRIGQLRFEAIADLDGHLAIASKHDEQNAVVVPLATDLPRFEGFDGKLVERAIADGFADPNDDLSAGGMLV